MDLTPRAKELRHNLTDAERKRWRALRFESLGAKFRRQVPLGNYIVDFVCLDVSLIVEVDGSQHLENEYDRQRDAWLGDQGFRVLRFWNNEVLGNLDGVVETIRNLIGSPHP
ncbi:MAG TPA: DUF559 domain-containing protein [Pantanalinema sp.]